MKQLHKVNRRGIEIMQTQDFYSSSTQPDLC